MTDPDSALAGPTRTNIPSLQCASRVVCAEEAQLALATHLVATTADAPGFAAKILAMADTMGLPKTFLADAGFTSARAVTELQAHKVEPLVAIAPTQPHRPYDFRPLPKPKPALRITEPWHIATKARLKTQGGTSRYES